MPAQGIEHPSLFDAPVWGSPVERERHRRIRLCVAAYAYEVAANPVMDDATFDRLALASVPQLRTGQPVLDAWWSTSFSPYTGQWITAHPDLTGIKRLYERTQANT